MNTLGLVFSGGGGKGGYQIGVGKYLHEIGLDRYVAAVSGTSVGALNALLFADGDFEKAERIWRCITKNKILTPKKIPLNDLTGWLRKEFLQFRAEKEIKQILLHAVRTAGVAAASAVDFGVDWIVLQLAAMLLKIRGDGIFSQDEMRRIMQREINFDRIQNASFPCYATCVEVRPEFQKAVFDLRHYEPDRIQEIVLASAAIPIVFDSVKFDGKQYVDGGMWFKGDNVPVKPVYDAGADVILVVHLHQDAVIDHAQFPNAKILEIVPQTSLGGVVDGTLDFTPEGAAWRIEQGYHDAKLVLEPFVNAVILGKKSEAAYAHLQRIWENSDREQREFRQKFAESQTIMRNDGIREILEDCAEEW